MTAFKSEYIDGMRIDWDIPIEMDDGLNLCADVFRPEDGKKHPVILTYGPEHTRGESELPWLFAVYIITWGAFFGYVFAMSRRQREMRREIELLRRVFEEKESQAASNRPE